MFAICARTASRIWDEWEDLKGDLGPCLRRINGASWQKLRTDTTVDQIGERHPLG
jgi:hypothetical protein